MKRFQLPFGVQDYLPEECYNKNLIEKKLADIFYSFGYERVETPTLEYYDLFNNIIDAKNINKMFKMTDNDGSLLVLRPDTTIQICRMAATKLNLNETNRLYYVANSFEYLSNTSSARTREFAQSGVELLGKTGIAGDLEVVVLAIKGLLSCGLDDFLIELGQVEFFKGLMNECELNSEDAKDLSALINNKDMLGMELFLQKRKFHKSFIQKFLMLPTLFGDENVLEKAKKICNNDMSLKALNNLKQIINGLKELGLDKYVSIDLGLVQGIDYYSGVVIRGVSKDLGLSLLDGGRYDTLINSFNNKMDAIGFAIGIKRLLIALENQNKLTAAKSCDYAYYSQTDDLSKEYAEAERLRNSDKRVVKCFVQNDRELIEFCLKHKIPQAYVVKKDKIQEVKVSEELCGNK